jgi:transcriptional regulator with PAS, ATPase and Fis domain
VDREEFRNDLYYALNVLSIDLAPLRRRREDILPYVDAYLDEWQERYKRYVHLTQGARQYMQEYDWPGNLDQVNSVCERIVLLTERRNVDEVFVRRQLEQVAPKMLAETETVVLFKDQKAAEIAQLLRKHNGNRAQVAEELGVSKTTLWRYIKKYGIAADYSY